MNNVCIFTGARTLMIDRWGAPPGFAPPAAAAEALSVAAAGGAAAAAATGAADDTAEAPQPLPLPTTAESPPVIRR